MGGAVVGCGWVWLGAEVGAEVGEKVGGGEWRWVGVGVWGR